MIFIDTLEHVDNENRNARKLFIIFIDTPEHVDNENKNARKLYIIFIDTPEHVDDENKNASAKKAAAAAERRARIMKQIAAQQSHFMKVTGSVQLI